MQVTVVPSGLGGGDDEGLSMVASHTDRGKKAPAEGDAWNAGHPRRASPCGSWWLSPHQDVSLIGKSRRYRNGVNVPFYGSWIESVAGTITGV